MRHRRATRRRVPARKRVRRYPPQILHFDPFDIEEDDDDEEVEIGGGSMDEESQPS